MVSFYYVNSITAFRKLLIQKSIKKKINICNFLPLLTFLKALPALFSMHISLFHIPLVANGSRAICRAHIRIGKQVVT